MLELRNCFKSYGQQKVLENVNVIFPNNGFYAVVGKSGSGKSTLLNLIGALDSADSGDIILDGKKYSELTANEFDELRKEKLGFIFQDFFLLDDLTVYQNIQLIINVAKNKYVDNVDEVLTELEIAHIKNKYPNQISGGERQRVAIARAICGGCKIILADEPTGNLDVENSNNIYLMLQKLSKKYLIIMVTHDLEASNYVDGILDIYKINNSAIIFTNDSDTPIFIESNEQNRYVVKSKLSMAFQLIKKKKKLFIPSMIIFTLFMFLNLLMGSLLFINPHETEYNAYKENEIDAITYSMWGYGDTINKDKVPVNLDKYDNVNLYMSSNIFIGDLFSFRLSSYSSEQANYVKYIIIDDSLGYKEVVISELLFDTLNYYDIYNSRDEIINNDCLSISGVKYTVCDIEDNDYKNIEEYLTSIETNYIKMSLESFELLRDYHLYENNDRITIINGIGNIDISHRIDLDNIVLGCFPENENEIAVAESFVNYIAPMETIIGSKYEVCGKTYTVVGVVRRLSFSYSIMFSDTEYDRVANEYFCSTEKYSNDKGIALFLDDESSMKVMEEMYNFGYFGNSSIANSLFTIVYSLTVVKKFSIFIAMLIILISTIMFNYIFNNCLSNFRNEIAILVSQGSTKKGILRVISLPVFLVFILALTISIICYLISVPFIDSYIGNLVNVTTSIIGYDFFAVLIAFAILAVAFIISAITLLLKLNKKSIIDLLYNR